MQHDGSNGGRARSARTRADHDYETNQLDSMRRRTAELAAHPRPHSSLVVRLLAALVGRRRARAKLTPERVNPTSEIAPGINLKRRVSRGYGYVQRFILAELDQRSANGQPWVEARTLAERLDGGDTPTKEACRSVRRALRRLAADGLVEIDPGARTSTSTGGRTGDAARIAVARMDEVTRRDATREAARALRRQLGDANSRYAPRGAARPYATRDCAL